MIKVTLGSAPSVQMVGFLMKAQLNVLNVQQVNTGRTANVLNARLEDTTTKKADYLNVKRVQMENTILKDNRYRRYTQRRKSVFSIILINKIASVIFVWIIIITS